MTLYNDESMLAGDIVFGRKTPVEWTHVEKYPVATLRLEVDRGAEVEIINQEFPGLVPWYDQGGTGNAQFLRIVLDRTGAGMSD
jgi:hypothetical protein